MSDQLPIVENKWYAAEFISDTFSDIKSEHRSYSPIQILGIKKKGRSNKKFILEFFHANYPEGVQDKTYSLEIIEHNASFMLARSMDHTPTRFLLIYRMSKEWLEKHFGGINVDPSYFDIYTAANAATKRNTE